MLNLLEVVRHSSAEAVDESVWRGGNLATMREIVVELNDGVRIQKPIQAKRSRIKDTAVDPVVVEIDRRVANAELPGPVP